MITSSPEALAEQLLAVFIYAIRAHEEWRALLPGALIHVDSELLFKWLGEGMVQVTSSSSLLDILVSLFPVQSLSLIFTAVWMRIGVGDHTAALLSLNLDASLLLDVLKVHERRMYITKQALWSVGVLVSVMRAYLTSMYERNRGFQKMLATLLYHMNMARLRGVPKQFFKRGIRGQVDSGEGGDEDGVSEKCVAIEIEIVKRVPLIDIVYLNYCFQLVPAGIRECNPGLCYGLIANMISKLSGRDYSKPDIRHLFSLLNSPNSGSDEVLTTNMKLVRTSCRDTLRVGAGGLSCGRLCSYLCQL